MSVVAPERILKELSDLWVTTGKHGQTEDGQGVLRACTMTLVVMAEASDDVMDLGETLAALMPEHPARAIVIRLTGAGARTLDQRVYAQCWRPFGQRNQICCEQVEITCSDTALADVPSVVLPLAVPDLPLFLWCRSARLLDMPEFREIRGMADRVVVADAPLKWIAAEVAAGRLVSDLAWTRLTRWREMLAQVFENRQNLAGLQKTAAIRVACGADAPRNTALYMAAWIQNALQDAGVTATATITSDLPGAALLAVAELRSGDLDVVLERHDDRMAASINGLTQQTHLPQPSDYLLMREELGIVRHDPIFERTVALATRLAYPTNQ
jgi:glucose-6-phosphate dehydrogenase assembly protein OpcA